MKPAPVIEQNGLNMPVMGFGTFELDAPVVLHMVPKVLELGYRHIDTAQIYGNESQVGQALESSGVDRGEVFLTTKVWVDRFEPARLAASVDESLERLRTDYLDLLLLHWPVFGEAGMGPTLEALMKVKADGRVRHIGISNFNIAQTREAVSICGPGEIATNQVEYHVYLGQEKLRDALEELGLVTTAYMPLAKGQAPSDPVLKEIGKAHGKSAAQVALRWLVEQNRTSAIPATSREENAASNLDVFDFELTDADRKQIAGLEKNRRICKPGSLSPQWDD